MNKFPIKKNIPKTFLKEYSVKKATFESALRSIKSMLVLRIGQLNARRGTRCRLVDARVKTPVKLWRNAHEKGYSVEDAFVQTEDILGVRIICNNLCDIDLVVAMINCDCSNLTILETKDMVKSPCESGYRAVHVRTQYKHIRKLKLVTEQIPCEIQVRTLAQDTWARLSRVDLYDKSVRPEIARLARALSQQLSTIDDIAQLIRDELTRTPQMADEITDSDSVTPERLALLYKDKYGKEINEWTLLAWVNNLRDAEISSIEEVRTLLDWGLRYRLNRMALKVRGYELEDQEWVELGSLVATGYTIPKGIKLAKKKILEDYEEITAQVHSSNLQANEETRDKND